MAAHFPQLAILEKRGLTHIKTLEDLVVFMTQVNTMLYKYNPHKKGSRKKDAAYTKYRRTVRKGFLAWLFNYTCQDCGTMNETKALHFHHLNPDLKHFNILQGSVEKPNKVLLFEEILKCVYLCENCHYQRHADIGDVDEDFTTINRRRHTYIQNLLGGTE